MLDPWIAASIGLDGPLTCGALERWQLSRLREIVDYARARSVFYRERLPRTEIRSTADFSALPFTTPDDIRHFGGQMLCVGPDDIDRIVTLHTSGSAGEPKRIYFTAEDQELTVDYFRHGMGEFVHPGARVMSLFPGETPGSLNDLLRRGLRRMDAELVIFGYPCPEDYPDALTAIPEQRIDSLAGPPSAIAGLARYSASVGQSEKLASHLQSVLLSAEYVSLSDRRDIERIWRCRVNEHYGMTETGLGGAVGCTEPGGYHVWASALYYEIIDPDTGKTLEPSAWGEIVVTTFARRGMPLIRYRTGDISRWLPGTCPCGSALPRLARVRSRPQTKKFLPRVIPDRF